MTGRFITFEGVEGGGKSTQIRLLADWLRDRGHDPVLTREPGGTALGREIRELVLHASNPIADRAELLLYGGDRAQHMAEVVEPALAAGRIVLCDRHADSLMAYQAFGRGLARDLVAAVNRVATGGRKPDLTLVLDLEPAAGLGRASARGAPDRLEREDLAFHLRVREGFLTIAAEEPDRVTVLDGAMAPEIVQERIRALVVSLKS
ncbi:MAG: dTMP kinase [Candidatus Sericytochromatia bacterium]|nr:dTMP kinase [Candidatus Tanganyikabacteria bacterium]